MARLTVGVLLAALLPALGAITTTAGASESAKLPARKAYVNGDSLAVGTAPFLRKELRRWRLNQTYDVSRHLDARTIASIPKRRLRLAPVMVIGLGTNDNPAAVGAYRQGVRQIMAIAGRRRCVVWTNIVRPPFRGVSYAGYKGVPRQEGRRRENLRVVDWAGMVRRNPRWLGRDGVHPGPTGYRARGRAIAREMETCRRILAR